jgi:hypothetical protein
MQQEKEEKRARRTAQAAVDKRTDSARKQETIQVRIVAEKTRAADADGVKPSGGGAVIIRSQARRMVSLQHASLDMPRLAVVSSKATLQLG